MGVEVISKESLSKRAKEKGSIRAPEEGFRNPPMLRVNRVSLRIVSDRVMFRA